MWTTIHNTFFLTSNIPVILPCISSHQQHRSNPEHNSVEDYFKKSIIIPFLDHLVSDISTRFTKHNKTAASIQELLPRSITSSSSFSKIEGAVAFYTADLPNPLIMDEEFCRWKTK